MTVEELRAKLTADLDHLRRQLAQLQQQARQTEVQMIKAQGAIEALTMLEQSDDAT